MDLILDLIVTVVSLSVIVQYSWSLKAHFNSPKMPTGTVVISVVVLTTAAIFVARLWIESQPALTMMWSKTGIPITLLTSTNLRVAIRSDSLGSKFPLG